jgi:kynurenine formamidase
MTSSLHQLVADLAAGTVQVVDLTQPLSAETPVIGLPPEFAPSPGLTLEPISRFDEKGPGWYWNVLHLGEHTGTHFDAPIHWITGRDLPNNACDTIPPGRLVGPACVIDITAEVAANPDFLLTRDALLAWEFEHGHIPAGAWVLLQSGWSRRQGAQEFLNADATGPHSPGPRKDALLFLLEERDILGYGAETVGTDAGQAFAFDPPFPAHTLLHGAGRFGLASLCNLDRLPPTGAVVIAAPLKIVQGSGSPIRALALAPLAPTTP